jgi:hypothetical protein
MQNRKYDWAHAFELMMSFFAPLQGTMILVSSFIFFENPSVAAFCTVLFSAYLFPLLTSRLVNILCPPREGRYPIGVGVEGWVVQLKIQMLLTTFPFFERVLHLLPGFYSLWLRAWGSHVGRGVMWTPHVNVLDRGLLHIEDGVLLGHLAILSSHAVYLKNDEHMVYCKRIHIGAGSLIGAASIIGPGANVGKGCRINVASHIYPDQIVNDGVLYDQRRPAT